MATNEALDQSLEWLLEEEGGWSNHPADRGGRTMYGVTQGTYDQWRAMRKATKQSVSKITKQEAHDLYEVMYWRAGGCDRLPWPISYLVFDAAVNSGPSRAVRWLQQGLGIPQDGRVGPNTIQKSTEAVDSGSGQRLLQILDSRIEFLARLVQRTPSQAAFLLGWWRRTMRVLARVLLTD